MLVPAFTITTMADVLQKVAARPDFIPVVFLSMLHEFMLAAETLITYSAGMGRGKVAGICIRLLCGLFHHLFMYI